MERFEESQQGYPEEAPPGSDPSGADRRSEDSEQRRGAKAGRAHPEEATETGDEGRTATGNPHSAG